MFKKDNFLEMNNIIIGVFCFAINCCGYSQVGKVWAQKNSKSQIEFYTNSVGKLESNMSEMNEIIFEFGITQIDQPLKSSKKENLLNIVEFTCSCDESELMGKLNSLNELFLKAELAPVCMELYIPNDYNLQPTLNYSLDLINAPEAWELSQGDSSIEIAIIDANFTVNHEELMSKYSFYDSTNTNSNYFHGNSVAIAAAGNSDNSVGLSSIGFNSKLQLRAMNYNQILEATYSGAKVINLSWTSGCYNNQFTQDVINEAYENGSTIIAAAGNGNTCGGPTSLVYPAAHEHVIAVTSIGPLDNHERYIGNINSTHQHNASVDLCAPGYDVLLSPFPNVYVTSNGTSFAAPLVSGAVALMLDVNPCLTPDEIEFILKQSAVNIDSINPQYAGLLGAGRIDVYEAIVLASHYSTINFSIDQVFNCLESTEQIRLNIDTTIYTISSVLWNTGDESTVLYNPLNGGNYSIEFTDENGCIGYSEIIADSIEPLQIDSEVNQISCFGESDGQILLNISGGNGEHSISWNSFSSDTCIVGSLSPGVYSVEVEDEFNCNFTETFLIVEPNEIEAQIVNDQIELYDYGFLTVTVNGGTPPFSYDWNTEDQENRININEYGFYEVEIIDSSGCVSSSNIFVDEISKPKGYAYQESGYLAIDEMYNANTLTSILSPNPADIGQTICLNKQFTYDHILIKNLLGEDVTEKFSIIENRIEQKKFVAAGMYFILFEQGENNISIPIIYK